jgi:hypothetical protein
MLGEREKACDFNSVTGASSPLEPHPAIIMNNARQKMPLYN